MIDLHPILAIVGRTIAGKEGPQKTGTAFLIAPDRVLTCAHCVAFDGEIADRLVVQFHRYGERNATISSGSYREDWDLAILDLDEPVTAGFDPPTLISTVFADDEWRTYGFAGSTAADGVDLSGNLGALGVAYGKPAIHIDGPKLRDKIAGASGAPIWGTHGVVGVLSKQRLKQGTYDTEAAFQTAYGIPLDGERLAWLLERSPKTPTRDHGPFSSLLPVHLPSVGDPRGFVAYYRDEPFGGREAELARLDAWLGDDERPWALIAAPSGRGKSTLVFRWCESLRARRAAHVAFAPVSIRFSTNGIEATAQILASRLRELAGVIGHCGTDQLDTLRREIRARSERPRRADQSPLVIVVDGIDEAARWKLPELGLPARLPAGVKVLLAMRAQSAEGALGELRLEEAGDVFLVPELSALDEAATRQAFLREFPGKEDAASQVYKLSEGDPLLVGMYIRTLREDQPEDLLSSIKEAESGWRGYMRRYWREQTTQWNQDFPDGKVDVLLSILATARGPISKQEIGMIAKERMSQPEMARAFGAIKRFYIAFPSGAGLPERVTLSHPKLPSFIRELFEAEAIDIDAFERAFLEASLDGIRAVADGRAKPSDYVLRHAAEHVRDAPRDQALAARAAGLATRAWYETTKALAPFDEAVEVLLERAASEGLVDVEIASVLAAASRESQVDDWLPMTVAGLVRAGLPPAEAATFVAGRMENQPRHRKQAQALALLVDKLPEGTIETLLARIPDEASRAPLLLEQARRRRDARAPFRVYANVLRRLRPSQADFAWALGLVAAALDGERRLRFARVALRWVHARFIHPAKRLRFKLALAVQLGDGEREEALRSLIAEANALPWRMGAFFSALAMPYLPELEPAALLAELDGIEDAWLRERRISEVAPLLVDRGLTEEIAARQRSMSWRALSLKAAAGFSLAASPIPAKVEQFRSLAYRIDDAVDAALARLALFAAAKCDAPAALEQRVDALVSTIRAARPQTLRPWVLRLISSRLDADGRRAWIEGQLVADSEGRPGDVSSFDAALAAVLEGGSLEDHQVAVEASFARGLPACRSAVVDAMNEGQLREAVRVASSPRELGRAIHAMADKRGASEALDLARGFGWSAVVALAPRLSREEVTGELERLGEVQPGELGTMEKRRVRSRRSSPRARPLVPRVERLDPTTEARRLFVALALGVAYPELQQRYLDGADEARIGLEPSSPFGVPWRGLERDARGTTKASVLTLLDLYPRGELSGSLARDGASLIGFELPTWFWSQAAVEDRHAVWRKALHARRRSRRHHVLEFLVGSAPTIAELSGGSGALPERRCELIARIDAVIERVQTDWP